MIGNETERMDGQRTSTATRGQVEAFVRGMLARSLHRFDCWLCGGKGRVKPADGTSATKRCQECKGRGTVEAFDAEGRPL